MDFLVGELGGLSFIYTRNCHLPACRVGGSTVKRFIPHPILLTFAIILDRIVISAPEIDIGLSLRPLLISLTLVTLIILVIQARVRDWHRAYFLTLLLLGSFILYRSVFRLLKEYVPPYAEYAALALIPILAWLYILISRRKFWDLIRNPARLSAYFSAVFAMLLLFQVIRLGGHLQSALASKATPQQSAMAPLPEKVQLRAESRPDMYIIVLDGYGRQDVLQQIYGYDNSEFLQELERRGFYVARDSHSNYIQTVYSIASLLNFDFIRPWEPPVSLFPYLLLPIRNNRVFQILDEIGYTTVSFESGTTYTQVETSDVYLSNFLPLNRFETLLLVDTPVEPLSDAFDMGFAIPGYTTHRERALYTIDELENIPASIPGPKIVYAHILLPHPPFVFDENGDALDPERPYSIWDGDEFQGTQLEYREGYRDQVIFVNHRILQVMDSLLKNSETEPIIVLMGDHGPGSMFKWDIESPGCLWERTSNLYAILLPGNQYNASLYPSMTPVNTFRLIFNTYFGTDLPMLEDNTYLMASQYQGQIADITQTRSSTASCSVLMIR
jgi:hypothetical protein